MYLINLLLLTPPPTSTSNAKVSKPAVRERPESQVPSDRDSLVSITIALAQAMLESDSMTRNQIVEDVSSKFVSKKIHQNDSTKTFLKFLYDLVGEIIDELMLKGDERKGTWKMRPSVESQKSSILAAVKQEVLILFSFEKRSTKESLIVRWSQKKRDRVDEILVRELHAEEKSWIDYSADEKQVKQTLSETIFNLILQDTLKNVSYAQ